MWSKRLHLVAAGVLVLVTATGALAAEDETWDGLTRVSSKRFERVYLLQGADFRAYTKVLIASPQVSFRKDWAQEMNRGVREPGRRITQSDVERIQRALAEGFKESLSKSFARAGWQVVGAAGPDVLQLTPVLVNVEATAPPQGTTAARVDTYTVQAGGATVALEVRDSETAMLLGRAVDRRTTVDYAQRLVVTDRVTNRADFEALLDAWSKTFVDGLAVLKEASPLGAAGKK